MSGTLEHMEHAAHAGHDDHGGGHAADNFNTRVGITMACLGVVLALLGAQLSAARNELVTAVTNQNITLTEFQGNAARARLLFASISELLAKTPDPAAAEVHRLTRMAQKFRAETGIALKWSEGYPALIEDHTAAAEHYEYGAIAAEIGIILASIGLLTKKRAFWAISVVLGVLSLGIGGTTYVSWSKAKAVHEKPIDAAQEEFFASKNAIPEAPDDDALLAVIQARFPGTAADPLEYTPKAAPAAEAEKNKKE